MPNIHPMLVHFPIALIIVTLIVDLLGIVMKNQTLIHAGTVTTTGALIGVIAAAISGIAVEDSVWLPGAAGNILESHELFGFITLGIIAVMAVIRFALRDKLAGTLTWLIVCLGTISSAIVIYVAYLGGEMVYTHGTGVKAAQECIKEKNMLKDKFKDFHIDDPHPDDK